MSFEVDRYPSAWAHIALCADLTWATEPPDEFIIANQVVLTLFTMTLATNINFHLFNQL